MDLLSLDQFAGCLHETFSADLQGMQIAFVLVLACRKDGPDDPVVNNGGGGQGGTGVSVDLAQVPYDSLS